ncbi:MAG: Ig-like domain-containing protein [Bacteroidales bacterium]|jgi:uncharacterized protein YjdB|nr:Ig-like domain-containing protein [Bacteroidales bacterium]
MKTLSKKAVAVCMAVCMLGFLSCDEEEIQDKEITVESVTVTPSEVNLVIGEAKPVVIEVKPAEADQSISWAIADSTVAVFRDGAIRGVSEGKTSITFSSVADASKTAVVSVTVVATLVPVESVTADPKELTLDVDAIRIISVTVKPEGANPNVSWTSADPAVATVDNGAVKGIAKGVTTITVASLADASKTDVVTVTVNDVLVNEIRLPSSPMPAFLDRPTTVIPEIFPANAADKTFILENSSPATADVTQNQGVILITPREPGATIITVTSASNKSVTASLRVTVWATVMSGAAGLWEFDNWEELTKASMGKNLVPHGTGYASTGGNAVRVSSGTWFSAPHDLPPSTGGTSINEYTFMFDFRIPLLDGRWYAYYNVDKDNMGVATCFLEGTPEGGKIGKHHYSDPFAQVNIWYRLVVIITPEMGRYYINGEKIYETAAAGRYSLPVGSVVLFGDKDGDDSEFDIAATALWGRALTDEEVKSLGKH